MSTPNYTYNGVSAPLYSAALTDGERILELQPSASRPPTNLPDQHVFQSQRIKLDLGPRIWPVSTPCFGYKDTIDGVVSVTTLEHVKSVPVKVEATVKAFFMERGVPGRHTESILFQRLVTLYTYSAGTSVSETILTYPFSIHLPETCDKSTSALPPSFLSSLPGVSAEVHYHICIDMSRSGLRRRESLVVPIMYLPHSYTPSDPHSLPFYNDQVAAPSQIQNMEEIHLAPKSTQTENQRSPPPSTDIQAKIALPSPLTVASGGRVPFIITIASRSQALAALYTDISLQLVKITIIKALQKTLKKEEALASGEVHGAEEPGSGVRILRGELGSGIPGAELSWSAMGVVEVRHVIRLSLKPPPTAVALSANIPTFERTVPLEVKTHPYTLEADTAFPALGLIGIRTN